MTRPSIDQASNSRRVRGQRVAKVPPAGVAAVPVMIEKTTSDDGTVTAVHYRIARDRAPAFDATIFGRADTSLPEALGEDELSAFGWLQRHLSSLLADGHAAPASRGAFARCFASIYGAEIGSAWSVVLVRELERSRLAQLRIDRDTRRMATAERAALEYEADCARSASLGNRPVGMVTLERARAAMARELPGAPNVPSWVSAEAVGGLLARLGFDGGGGASKRVSSAAIRRALASPEALAEALHEKKTCDR